MLIKTLTKEILYQNIQQIKSIVEYYPIERQNPWSKDQYLYDISGKWLFSNLAVSGKNQISGFILASEKIKNNVHIHKFYVHKNSKQQKIGSKLFVHLYDKAKNNNIKTLSVKVYKNNTKALGFYNNLGFVSVYEIIDVKTNLILIEMSAPLDLIVLPKLSETERK